MSALYTTDILRLAVAAARHGRLDPPCLTAQRRSATCGSRIIVDIRPAADGTVSAVGLAVDACAMGQAAAEIFAAAAPGAPFAALRQAAVDVQAWLRQPDAPLPDWPGIAVLAPARAYPARHDAILLPFVAAVDALRDQHIAA